MPTEAVEKPVQNKKEEVEDDDDADSDSKSDDSLPELQEDGAGTSQQSQVYIHLVFYIFVDQQEVGNLKILLN